MQCARSDRTQRSSWQQWDTGLSEMQKWYECNYLFSLLLDAEKRPISMHVCICIYIFTQMVGPNRTNACLRLWGCGKTGPGSMLSRHQDHEQNVRVLGKCSHWRSPFYLFIPFCYHLSSWLILPILSGWLTCLHAVRDPNVGFLTGSNDGTIKVPLAPICLVIYSWVPRVIDRHFARMVDHCSWGRWMVKLWARCNCHLIGKATDPWCSQSRWVKRQIWDVDISGNW